MARAAGQHSLGITDCHQEITEQDFAQSLVGTLNEVTPANAAWLQRAGFCTLRNHDFQNFLPSGCHGTGSLPKAWCQSRKDMKKRREKNALVRVCGVGLLCFWLCTRSGSMHRWSLPIYFCQPLGRCQHLCDLAQGGWIRSLAAWLDVFGTF